MHKKSKKLSAWHHYKHMNNTNCLHKAIDVNVCTYFFANHILNFNYVLQLWLTHNFPVWSTNTSSGSYTVPQLACTENASVFQLQRRVQCSSLPTQNLSVVRKSGRALATRQKRMKYVMWNCCVFVLYVGVCTCTCTCIQRHLVWTHTDTDH